MDHEVAFYGASDAAFTEQVNAFLSQAGRRPVPHVPGMPGQQLKSGDLVCVPSQLNATPGDRGEPKTRLGDEGIHHWLQAFASQIYLVGLPSPYGQTIPPQTSLQQFGHVPSLTTASRL
jgi:hypothetical protein